MSSNVQSVAVGVTGASGVLYAVRTIAALLSTGIRVEVVVSDIGRRLLQEELGVHTENGQLESYLADRYGVNVPRDLFVLHSNKNVGASIASGSYLCDAMVIIPCSMKTLAGVAHGSSTNLIERAADVILKERRRLVVVPRETPMSLPQLRNMVLAAEAGAHILPAMPAFYQQPETLDDLADFIAGKVLSCLDIQHSLFPQWTG